MDKFQVPAYFIGRRPSKVTKDHEVELESYYLLKGCIINYNLLLLHKTCQSITREGSLEVKHELNEDSNQLPETLNPKPLSKLKITSIYLYILT